MAELLVEADLGPQERDLARSIQRQGEAMQVVIDDVLELSKITAGALELMPEIIAPRTLVDDVVTTFGPAATVKGLDLTVAIDDSVPLAIRADRHRIRQVLVNLVSNAIKYTETGSVNIRVSEAGQDRLRILVADTGCGIEPQAQVKLFEPFTQARSADQIKGTGLGLSITRRLVDLMAGEIYLTSSPEGSTFCVVLPHAPARRNSDLVAGLGGETLSGRRRILVVDDSEVNRMVAQSQLERLGHEPHLVDGGEAALESLRMERFDLMLLDWHMPVVDGLEVIDRYLRWCGESSTTPIPIVMMTASVSGESKNACLEAGATEFLPKPVTLSDLERCLDGCLQRAGSVAGSAPSSVAIPGSDSGAVPSPGEPALNSTANTAHYDSVNRAIDRSVIDQMVDDLGGPEPVRMVIDTFMVDANSRRQELADQDTETASRAAHTLQSTCRMLGATELSNALSQLEDELRARGRTAIATTTTSATTDISAIGDLFTTALNELAEISHQLA